MIDTHPLFFSGRRLNDTVCRSMPPLAPGELARAAEVLSAEERERAARFHFEADRAAYISAHSLLRRTLSEVEGRTEPDGWRFNAEAGGRPFVCDHPRAEQLDFSLSHARGRVAVLVTTEARCGVDVERVGRVNDPMLLATSAFSNVETDDLRAEAAPLRDARFTAIWTLREAYLKAEGTGLAAPLDAFYFRLDRLEGAPSAFSLLPGAASKVWEFSLFRPDGDHFLAAALARPV